jgi:PAS domain S-box-containing protein
MVGRRSQTKRNGRLTEDSLYHSLFAHSRDSERFLVDLTESLADAVIVFTLPDLRIEYANKALTEILGYEVEEAVGMLAGDLFPDPTRHLVFQERLDAALEDGKERFCSEQALNKRNGGKVWTEIVATLIDRDGEISSLVGVVRDITDRKLAEEALIRSQARLELLNSILAGMKAGSSVEEMIEIALDRLQEHFADTRTICARVSESDTLEVVCSREPAGRPNLAGMAVELSDVPEWVEELNRGRPLLVADLSAEETAEGREPFVGADTVSVLEVPLYSSNDLAGLLALHAFSPRKWGIHEIDTLSELAAHLSIALKDDRAEEEKQQLEDQLRQSQKMEAVGRLAGGVAHDFNNLLTGITGYTELALSQVDDESVCNDLRSIREFGDRAAQLTRQLLAFSRRQPLEPVSLDLNSLIHNTTGMLARLIGEDVRLEFSPGANSAVVEADAGQIEQVLMNLAVNSRDAMPNGGRLLIETQNILLDQAYADRHAGVSPGRYVMVAVSDTGQGMDKNSQERIFEPFFTTKERGKGTGLGLSTVYGIVKQHGGNIWVYSEPGYGTTFKIYLPCQEQVVKEIETGRTPMVDLHGDETILLVEDEVAVGGAIIRALESYGYRVLSASGPEQAMDVFAENQDDIDVLLADVILPGCDGRQLHQRMLDVRDDLRVLFMSGYTDKALTHNVVLDPGVPFIQKPFTPAQIARKVRAVLAA